MANNFLKYDVIKKFVQGVEQDVLKYVGKSKVCIVGLGGNGVFYGEGLYQWFKKEGFDVAYTTINDEGRGLNDERVRNRKVLVVDSHIITGKCYQRALGILRSKQKKLNIEDIKCAVMHDLRGFADFVVERYLTPRANLDRIDLEIIKMLLQDGKKPFTEIAEKTGLTSVGIKNRVERLFKQEILEIKGLVNLRKFYSVSANIGIGADSLTCQKIIRKIKNNPLVFNLMKVSGSNKDLIIDIVAPNMKIIEDFLDREIKLEPKIRFLEVNIGGLPIIPKLVNIEKFKFFGASINLAEK